MQLELDLIMVPAYKQLHVIPPARLQQSRKDFVKLELQRESQSGYLQGLRGGGINDFIIG